MALFCASSAGERRQDRRDDFDPSVRARVSQLTVMGDNDWTNTALDLKPGDRLLIAVQLGQSHGRPNAIKECEPEGKLRTWEDLLLAYPLNTVGQGALIGRIGPDPAVPFMIGKRLQTIVTQTGQLFLGMNMVNGERSRCAFNVTVRVQSRPTIAENWRRVEVPRALLGRIPRRIVDGSGSSGDMVNFVVVGSEEQVLLAFQRAGWLAVDRTPEEAAVHVLLASMRKEAYTEMPMSNLYLFGRVQDYGFARAKPLEVITIRHHLRIWRTTLRVGAQPLWVGAATHDIGLEPDQRNGSAITHKIDPCVDNERDYLQTTLMAGGSVQSSDLVLPPLPVRQGRTATGGSFRSDGRILVLLLGGN